MKAFKSYCQILARGAFEGITFSRAACVAAVVLSTALYGLFGFEPERAYNVALITFGISLSFCAAMVCSSRTACLSAVGLFPVSFRKRAAWDIVAALLGAMAMTTMIMAVYLLLVLIFGGIYPFASGELWYCGDFGDLYAVFPLLYPLYSLGGTFFACGGSGRRAYLRAAAYCAVTIALSVCLVGGYVVATSYALAQFLAQHAFGQTFFRFYWAGLGACYAVNIAVFVVGVCINFADLRPRGA